MCNLTPRGNWQTLMYSEANYHEFVCLSFSPDSKYLVTLGGVPDWGLLYWAWEKSQGPMAVTKCSASVEAPVYRVSFNPQDNTHLCVTGNTILKMCVPAVLPSARSDRSCIRPVIDLHRYCALVQ